MRIMTGLLIFAFSLSAWSGGGGGPPAPPAPPDLDTVLDGPVNAISVQADDQIIMAGDFSDDNIVKIDGSDVVDTDFGDSWTADAFNNEVLDLVSLADGSVVAVGRFTVADTVVVGSIAKLAADGSIDSAFALNAGTGFDAVVNSIELMADGSFLVAGEFTSFNGSSVSGVAKLNSDGSLDSSFDPVDSANGPVNKVKEVVGGAACLIGGDYTSYDGAESLSFTKLIMSGERASSFFSQN